MELDLNVFGPVKIPEFGAVGSYAQEPVWCHWAVNCCFKERQKDKNKRWQSSDSPISHCAKDTALSTRFLFLLSQWASYSPRQVASWISVCCYKGNWQSHLGCNLGRLLPGDCYTADYLLDSNHSTVKEPPTATCLCRTYFHWLCNSWGFTKPGF